MEDPDDDEDSPYLPELDEVINSSFSSRGMFSSQSPPTKRRRIDPPPALSKPFRSPFKTPSRIALPSTPSADLNSNYVTPNKARPILTPTTALSNRRSTVQLSTNGTLPSSSAPSPHLGQLQKQHTSFLNQLSFLRASLETTNQALDIEASTTDADLEALITKWKTVSRNAAEEVFMITKERVDGMGGVRAWRKKEREKSESWGWDGEEIGKGGGVTVDGREAGLRNRVTDATTNETEMACETAQAEGEEDEEFSMETMLKSLDIPLKVIGYNAIEQRWLD